jgi:hypothetical protein
MASFFESSAAVNRQVFEEDHQICISMPYDSWCFEPLKYASDAEMKIEHFRSLLKKFHTE